MSIKRAPKPTTALATRKEPPIAYHTTRGQMYHSLIEDFLSSPVAARYKGRVQLIFTSPPFPLNRKKKYGNKKGDDYKTWLAALAPGLISLLTPTGSLVIEVGNAWESGRPVMSVLAMESLLAFMHTGELNLCQQFVCDNPARLPSPAQWVNVERIRVKDSFTHVWWMAKTDRPKADNRRVLKQYSPAMRKLLKNKRYNSGPRPSQHHIGATSFLEDNGGAIPSSCLSFANTAATDTYLEHCRAHNLKPHPARMPLGLVEFFINFLTDPNDIVLDPFAGSNTTGAVAEKLERRWVAIETEEGYVAASLGRFANAKRGPRKRT